MTPEAGPYRRNDEVPVKTILATIGLVLATYFSWRLIQELSNIIQLILIAAFFALVLNPAVDLLEYRLKVRRGFAATFVFFTGIVVFSALLYLFVQPLIDQTLQFVDNAPQIVNNAQEGRGTIGHIIEKYNVTQYVTENQARLREALTASSGSALAVFTAVVQTIASLFTVLVLTFMMLLYGRDMVRLPLIFFDPSTQHRIRRVANDASKAVTGYVIGNLLISVIAGIVTFVTLAVLHVPFAVVLAVWVAFADMIPLVGATIGAIPTVLVATLHSPSAGITAFIVYVIYQQVENQIIQPSVMSKTVNLNPLVILVSALIGFDFGGFLGALLAIPVAGAIQVIGRDLFEHRHQPFRGERTADPTASDPAAASLPAAAPPDESS